jgi:hypothetical protein
MPSEGDSGMDRKKNLLRAVKRSRPAWVPGADDVGSVLEAISLSFLKAELTPASIAVLSRSHEEKLIFAASKLDLHDRAWLLVGMEEFFTGSFKPRKK